MFDLKLLGGASIEGPEGPLSGPAVQRHRLALLAILAAAHPGGSSRDKLAVLLWPERDEEHGRKLLTQAVHKLRKALGDEAIVSAGDELRLGVDRLAVDLLAFREALGASRLERTVELYGGPFLDGFFLPSSVEFERWAEGERRRLRRDYLRALEGLAEEAAARGDPRGAVEWWRRLAAEDMYSSWVTLRLMEALEAAGDREAAIRQSEAHREFLARELDAEPSPEVTALAERMRTAPLGVPAPVGVGVPAAAAVGGEPAVPRAAGDQGTGAPVDEDQATERLRHRHRRWKTVATGAFFLIVVALLALAPVGG